MAGPVFAIDRSADGVTVVLADEVLFAGFGSAWPSTPMAEFDSVAPWAGAVTTTVIAGAVAPGRQGRPRAGHRHVARVACTPTRCPDADTNVTPAGRVSTTETLAASDGPTLSTTSE